MNAKDKQNASGCFSLKLLDDYAATFTPEEAVKVKDWYRDADVDIRAFEKKDAWRGKTTRVCFSTIPSPG